MISKTGFIFPGQGSQVPGMGLDIFKNHPAAKDIFDQADEIFGSKLSEICFSASCDILQRTDIAQPAMLTVSAAICAILKQNSLFPDLIAGHSLGEYSALVCSEVLDFATAFKLVKLRGKLMAKAGEKFPGTMVAVVGSNKKELEEECMNFSNDNSVVIANYNGPQQLVISGTLEAIERFSALMVSKGKRVIPLNVSGAFHSHLMKPALEELVEAIEDTYFHDAKIPIVTNIDSAITTEGKKFKEKLKWQLISPVLWEDCVNCMIEQRVSNFVEIGPQKVLSKLVKRLFYY
ncbi:MAG: [acyl-carrier-protein] S-malonyltransferase [Pedobacter sp.]|nr:MAG: [acyl-carrier-protein] S-malonyltransferase [Pedobacter sp.]